jgi:hypothetical protein
VNAFTVTAHTRQLPMDSTHERILPREKEPGRAVGRAAFILEQIDKQ